jgi:Mitochondrial ribosomal protein (VAR1)
MKNNNFEIKKTNTNTIQTTNMNSSLAENNNLFIMPTNNLNTYGNISHITKQKGNYIPLNKDMMLVPLKSSDKVIRHNPAATSEWNNSNYSYLKGELQVSPVVDQYTHELIKMFFNSTPKNIGTKKSLFRHKSILKTYISAPRIKTSINRARITIYKYDRKKLYYINMLNKTHTLWPNLKLCKQEVNEKPNNAKAFVRKNLAKKVSHLYSDEKAVASKRTRTPLSNLSNITGKSRNVFSSLDLGKKAVRKMSTITRMLTSNKPNEQNNPFFLPTVIKPRIRKVLFGYKNMSITIATVNNPSIPAVNKFSRIAYVNIKKPMQKETNNPRKLLKTNVLTKHRNDEGRRSPIRIKRISLRYLGKLKKKAKKSIFLNIIRNNTLQFVLNKDKEFKKGSFRLLKNIQNDTIVAIKKIKMSELLLSVFINIPFTISTNYYLLGIANNMTGGLFSFEKRVLDMSVKKNKEKPNFYNKLIAPKLCLNLPELFRYMYKNMFSSKYYSSILLLNSIKSSYPYLYRLVNILKKRYNKNISLNVVYLKYLYLDSNIMATAITTKLKDRKKRVLRVLKRILGLIKKPYFKIHLYNKKKTLEKVNSNFLLMDKNRTMSTYSLNQNNLYNKELFENPSHYKPRLFLYHLKHKTVSGVRIQGSGRLTRRLTASRSISKYKYMGSLQNLESSRQGVSTIMLRGFMKSNLQYNNINSYNRNGAFGVKVSVSSY